ncbi:MAG TPA: glycosyltransferase family 39 protein [Thermoanaerobaculia bacterium]
MTNLTSRRALYLLAGLIATTTFIRLALGLFFFGFHTGDDVEILQAGFLRAFGRPYEPWSIRNLLVSDLLVTPALAAGRVFGVASPRVPVWLASVPFVLLASINIGLVFALARRFFAQNGAALLAATLYAFHWIPLGYGSTVYPRTASTTCVLLAALLLSGTGRVWREALAGGLMAVALAVRYSEAIFLFPMLAALWLRAEPVRNRLARSAAFVGGLGVLVLFTVGLEDWLTWGKPFSSLVAFAEFTLVERQSSSLDPAQPWYWYLWRLPKWLPLTLLPFLWRSRRAPHALTIALYVLLPLLFLSLIHQKQLRYLQGVIPFLILLATAGAWSLWVDGRRRLTAALCVLSVLLGLGGITFLSKKSMAAVQAAQDLTAQGVTAVALSQSWAYGGTLFLGSKVAVLDLPYPLRAPELEQALVRTSCVALYKEDLEVNPELSRLLDRHGFVKARGYRWGRSKPVEVWQLPRPPAQSPDVLLASSGSDRKAAARRRGE